MGLTRSSMGSALLNDEFQIEKRGRVVALAGNPNVGKSTVFNALTGLKQHTGNWPGKTIENATGYYEFRGKSYTLVDIPGTYSLLANSKEEEIARDFICFGDPDVSIVVADATCLERNLNLVLQTLEITDRVVVCLNLMDQANRNGIHIDTKKLSSLLGVPVVETTARAGKGLKTLMETVEDVCANPAAFRGYQVRYHAQIERALEILQPSLEKLLGQKMNARWMALRLLEGEAVLLSSAEKKLGFSLSENPEIQSRLMQAKAVLGEENYRDRLVADITSAADYIYHSCVRSESRGYHERDGKIDRILTSKRTGIPIMLLFLAGILWLTIEGANYPSQLLSNLLFGLEEKLLTLFEAIHAPEWLTGVMVTGVYRTLAWVVSVMLPPMALFFPLFTLLEDFGYLPRIAFNLDHYFKKAHAHGKQALTTCMGFGCNACGVMGCRIIDSPRERLIAILTNCFVPCNGRFPTITSIIAMFFITGAMTGALESLYSTLILMGIILLGIFMTLLVSRLLSKTVLKGMPSSFVLELPPYRKPQFGKVLVRSLFDRTLFVLGRAVTVAIPAGLIIWCMANIDINGISILKYCTDFLDPFGRFFGMDGVIIMAFLLGLPANEIVIPIIVMCYLGTGSLSEFENLQQLRVLLVENGWTWLTAVCTLIFTLLHFPCGTTLATIKKETGSKKWTVLSFLLPTALGLVLCLAITSIARLFHLV